MPVTIEKESVPFRPQARAKAHETFTIEQRISLKLDFDFAVELGEYLVSTNPANPAIYAMACRLRDMLPKE